MVKKTGNALGRSLQAKENKIARMEGRLYGTGPVRSKRKKKAESGVEDVPPITP